MDNVKRDADKKEGEGEEVLEWVSRKKKLVEVGALPAKRSRAPKSIEDERMRTNGIYYLEIFMSWIYIHRCVDISLLDISHCSPSCFLCRHWIPCLIHHP
tara:strand:- start:907 stop:1206 length:300 start_codon:yes stop_codon:yes gene_type:complete